MAEEISRPLCGANKVTMVCSGGGEVGAAKLSGEVLNIMTRLPDAVEKLTGVNISQVTHVRLQCFNSRRDLCALSQFETPPSPVFLHPAGVLSHRLNRVAHTGGHAGRSTLPPSHHLPGLSASVCVAVFPSCFVMLLCCENGNPPSSGTLLCSDVFMFLC